MGPPSGEQELRLLRPPTDAPGPAASNRTPTPGPPAPAIPQEAAVEIRSLEGYQASVPRFVLFVLGCICTGGILGIVCTWFPQLFTRLCRKACPVAVASHILVEGTTGRRMEVPVKHIVVQDDDDDVPREHRFIDFCTVRYIWRAGAFQHCEYDTAISYRKIDGMRGGLSGEEHTRRARMYGTNLIDIPIEPVAALLFTKCVHPFYLFQVFSVILWYAEAYSFYATTILLSSGASVAWEVYRARSNALDLQKAAHHDLAVRALRDGKEVTISSRELTPGDVVRVEADAPVAADMVLLSGECVVDESMLTGESTPLAKQALPCAEKPDEVYAAERQKTCSLYCGSRVLQARGAAGQPPTALVMRTGFSTAKGQLFRTILFPRPIRFKFSEDSYKFLAFMAVAAVTLCVVNVVIKMQRGSASLGDIMLSSLDLITITVPPALPLVLTMGTGFALGRLNRQRVFCIAPQRINFAGRIDTMMFDKTGTLTHDSLDFYGAHGAEEGRFGAVRREVGRGDAADPMVQFMATCHALVRVNEEVVGHPVDVKMFHTAAWEMLEADREQDAERSALAVMAPPGSGRGGRLTTLVLRRFEFDVRIQRSSVLVRVGSGPSAAHFARVKGSLEALRPLCRPDSLPPDLEEVMRGYTRKGLYVLACAERALPALDDAAAATFKREEAEAGLTFLGLLLLQNSLKAESPGVIKQLLDARIQPLLVTGDAALTAVYVARELALLEPGPVLLLDAHKGKLTCADVDRPEEALDIAPLLEGPRAGWELAVTGAAMAAMGPGPTLEKVVRRAKVFARVLPEQKALIAETLIEVHGKFVGMCGDGTNDCGALKAAHIGLSLSEAEASIVAPFTSADRRVAAIVDLLREGRCALTTSFVAFKYMAMYPLIQLFMVTRLYLIDHTLGDWQYLFDDLALVLPLGALMCATGPAGTLVRDRPVGSLFSLPIVASLAGQIALTLVFLAAGNLLLASHAARTPELYSQSAEDGALLRDGIACPPEMGNEVCSYENTVSWAYAHFQFLSIALAFSVGKPFRRPFHSNLPYALLCAAVFIVLSLILLAPNAISNRLFLTLPLPADLRWELYGLALANFAAYWLWEYLVIAVEGWRQGRHLEKLAVLDAGVPELPLPAPGGGGGPGLREAVAQAFVRSTSPTLQCARPAPPRRRVREAQQGAGGGRAGDLGDAGQRPARRPRAHGRRLRAPPAPRRRRGGAREAPRPRPRRRPRPGHTDSDLEI
eukprot:tig00000880_g5186.t1